MKHSTPSNGNWTKLQRSIGSVGATLLVFSLPCCERTPASSQPVGQARIAQAEQQLQPRISRPQPTSRRFDEILGVSTKFSQGEPLADLSLLAELGVSWARDTVPWPTMEPQPGHYTDFPAEFRTRLEFYKAHDIGVVFLLAYDNTVAYPPTASNPTAAIDAVAYGKFAVHVARLMRHAGVRFVIELWNEPHNMVIRRVLGGNWNGAPPSPWVDHYVKMVREAVRQVKALDPSIELIDDDDMWVLHYRFLEAGLPSELDGIAFHPYVQGIPEKAAITRTTEWMAPFVAVDDEGSFVSAVSKLRMQGAQRLGHPPKMWITEWGWPVGATTDGSPSYPEDVVAAWLPRAFILAQASGARALCWFSTQDSVDGPMGLTRNDGTRRKTYAAYKALSMALGDYEFVEQLEGTAHPTSGAQAFLFRRPGSAKVALWSVEPASILLDIDGPLQSAVISNHLGQRLAHENTLRVGAEPIYLELQSRGPSDLPRLRFSTELDRSKR